jgi:hypothetical protein
MTENKEKNYSEIKKDDLAKYNHDFVFKSQMCGAHYEYCYKN